MKHRYITLVLLCSFAGCANNVWYKPGASANDFEADKYTCLQQSQQQASSAAVNQYGGAAQSGSVTNWNLFNSCMGSKGYSLQDKNALNNSLSQNDSTFKQKQAEYVNAIRKFDEKFNAVCAKPEYAAFFVKTTCSAKDITFEQLADSTKITQEQKTILPKYRTAVDIISKERSEYAHTNGPDGDKRWADYIDSTNPEVDKYNLDLYNGIITWGEYNQHRKDLSAKIQTEYKRMFPATH
jgi:hypothetical protein